MTPINILCLVVNKLFNNNNNNNNIKMNSQEYFL